MDRLQRFSIVCAAVFSALAVILGVSILRTKETDRKRAEEESRRLQAQLGGIRPGGIRPGWARSS